MKIPVMVGITLACLVCLILTACDGDTYVYQQDSCTPTPASTELMQSSWVEAKDIHYYCQLQVEERHIDCIEETPDDHTACIEAYDLGVDRCLYWYVVHLSKITIRECGAKIAEVYATQEPESYQVTFDFETDTDGDGISNYEEMLMGMNPCEEYSFGTCNPADADLDYDVDGLPNGEDDLPRCNPSDPSGNQSDCI